MLQIRQCLRLTPERLFYYAICTTRSEYLESYGALGMYVEGVAVFPGTSAGDFVAQADIGWTYSPNENLQWDIGANFGLNDAAPDFNPFLGVSIRF